MTTGDLIKKFNMKPLHEEGGYYAVSYRSDDIVKTEALPDRYKSPRSAGGAIYYLLSSESDSFSALHALNTDEVWHFYLGDPLEMLLLHPSGDSEIIILGQDIAAGQRVQYTVPKGVWQGTRLIKGGEFALAGNTMSPAFDYEDYIHGNRKELLGQYPDRMEMIIALTRE